MLMLSLIVAQTTGSYPLMLIPFVLASVGSGAFHPVGAMHAAESSRSKAATNTSLFFLAGQIGLGVGPVLAGILLDRAATHNNLFTNPLGTPYAHSLMERGTVAPVLALALIALPGVVYMATRLPSARAHLARRAAALPKAGAAVVARGALPVRAFLLLALVVTLRSLINPGTVTFIPILFEEKGWSATEYGLVTSFFWLGGGLAGVLVGMMADRYDSRLLVAATLILSAPALFLLTVLDGPIAFALALATGALSGGSHSLLVVQAQGLIPGSKGFASGAILGFMFATGAVGSLLIGGLSDSIGLANAFNVVAAVTVVTGLLGLALPPDRRFAAAPAPQPEAVGEAVAVGK
jgi:FSR family fosmidomycin resistance protein-like MFS transporter